MVGFFFVFLFFVWGERGKGREGGEEREGGKEGRGGKGGKGVGENGRGRKRKWEREKEGKRKGKEKGEVERERKEKKEEKGEKQVALMLWACENYWKNLRTLICGLFLTDPEYATPTPLTL